ncbi:MAG: hypothetical protein AAF518_14925 [Spirochaetota bacterium]
MKQSKLSNSKSAVLFSLIGDHLPKEALSMLSAQEIQKLMDKLAVMEGVSTGEEANVLAEFSQKFSANSRNVQKQTVGVRQIYQGLFHLNARTFEHKISLNGTLMSLQFLK